MASKLYFGVELEFCIGYVAPGQQNPDPTSPKMIIFPFDAKKVQKIIEDGHYTVSPTHDDLFSILIRKDRNELFLPAACRHIGDVFVSSGLPYSHDANTGKHRVSLDNWTITDDNTIEIGPQPDQLGYMWFPMEIRSPAYELNDENLGAVEKVSEILDLRYVVRTPDSTGLHVHFSVGVGKGAPTWKFETMQRILQFFWAFHTQFDTLHPPHRQITEWARSMRVDSEMVDKISMRGTFPSVMAVMEGVDELGKAKDMEELLRMVMMNGFDRCMAYNVCNLVCFLQDQKSLNSTPLRERKPTIEFRQHAGTVDGKAVSNWVRTLGAVIKFVQEAAEDEWQELMKLTLMEKWQKTGGKEDAANEKEHGFVVVKDKFTIIDLLERIGAKDQADFYRTGIYQLVDQPRKDQEENTV